MAYDGGTLAWMGSACSSAIRRSIIDIREISAALSVAHDTTVGVEPDAATGGALADAPGTLGRRFTSHGVYDTSTRSVPSHSGYGVEMRPYVDRPLSMLSCTAVACFWPPCAG